MDSISVRAERQGIPEDDNHLLWSTSSLGAAAEAHELRSRLVVSFRWTPPQGPPEGAWTARFGVFAGHCAASVLEGGSEALSRPGGQRPESAPPLVLSGRRHLPLHPAKQSLVLDVPPDRYYTVALQAEPPPGGNARRKPFVVECHTFPTPPALSGVRGVLDEGAASVGFYSSRPGSVWWMCCAVADATPSMWEGDVKQTAALAQGPAERGVATGCIELARAGKHAVDIPLPPAANDDSADDEARAAAWAGQQLLVVLLPCGCREEPAAAQEVIRFAIGPPPASVDSLVANRSHRVIETAVRLRGPAADAGVLLHLRLTLMPHNTREAVPPEMPLSRLIAIEDPEPPCGASKRKHARAEVRGPGPHRLCIVGAADGQRYGAYAAVLFGDASAAADRTPHRCQAVLPPWRPPKQPLLAPGTIDTYNGGRPLVRPVSAGAWRPASRRPLPGQGPAGWQTHISGPASAAHLNEHLRTGDFLPPPPPRRLATAAAQDSPPAALRRRVVSTAHALELKQHFLRACNSARPSASLLLNCPHCTREHQRVAALPVAEADRGGKGFHQLHDRCTIAKAATNVHRRLHGLQPLRPFDAASLARWLDLLGAGENNLRDAPWQVTWQVFLLVSVCDEADAALVGRIRHLFDAAVGQEEIRGEEHFSELLRHIADAAGISSRHPDGRPRTGFSDADMYRGRACDACEAVTALLLSRRDNVCLIKAKARGCMTDRNFAGHHCCAAADRSLRTALSARRSRPRKLLDIEPADGSTAASPEAVSPEEARQRKKFEALGFGDTLAVSPGPCDPCISVVITDRAESSGQGSHAGDEDGNHLSPADVSAAYADTARHSVADTHRHFNFVMGGGPVSRRLSTVVGARGRQSRSQGSMRPSSGDIMAARAQTTVPEQYRADGQARAAGAPVLAPVLAPVPEAVLDGLLGLRESSTFAVPRMASCVSVPPVDTPPKLSRDLGSSGRTRTPTRGSAADTPTPTREARKVSFLGPRQQQQGAVTPTGSSRSA
eukprot:TRINITY_DN12317_c0_g1_i1.p1 TRINITY_DN12317_c0_g1~~TRINITY_DN12317_c0_g1_i1.p1  ORF type:complete len:1009 (+),score=208.24 TRINITY_DN12317_c0_g1_i1:140-3166(+)